MPIPETSTVAVRTVQELSDITADRLFERREGAIVAGAAQVLHIALREVLIFVANRRRYIDIFDVRRSAERSEHGEHQVAKAARPAGADIEDARYRRLIDQPAQHRNCVIDMDEIAPLL